MSKSEVSDNSRINLTDDSDTIAVKIRRAKTDSEPLPSEVEGLSGRAEASNLVGIYASLLGVEVIDVLSDFGGQGFASFKSSLADLAITKLSPISKEMRHLLKNPSDIDMVLEKGAEQASNIARPILSEVREITGFLGRSTDRWSFLIILI